MLYAIVVLVILIVILLVFLGRFASNQVQRSRLRAQQERARRDPESHPPDILTRELAPRPTLTGVANEISGRWLNGDRPRNGEAYDPIQRRSQDTYYGASSVYRDRTGNRGGVTREGVEQDAELPSYNDRSTIPIPQAAYSSPIQARHDTRNSNDTFIQPPASHPTDQPPKYDSPIVRQL